MHSETGKLYKGTEEELSVLEKTLGDKLKKLTNEEYVHIRTHDEPARPEELALLRFVEERKRLKAPHGIEVQNAFRLGYRAAVEDRS